MSPASLAPSGTGGRTRRRTSDTRLNAAIIRLRILVAAVCLLAAPAAARADVVLDWNAIAIGTVGSQSPFAQARYMAIVQLAVFEAVNAVNGGYEPLIGNDRRAGSGIGRRCRNRRRTLGSQALLPGQRRGPRPGACELLGGYSARAGEEQRSRDW